MQIKAKASFLWAHRGCDVEQFAAGQIIETADADLVRVATQEGWAEPIGVKSTGPASNKAHQSAPENK